MQLDYYGRRLATCSSDTTIKIFDVAGEQLTPVAGGLHCLTEKATHPLAMPVSGFMSHMLAQTIPCMPWMHIRGACVVDVFGSLLLTTKFKIVHYRPASAYAATIARHPADKDPAWKCPPQPRRQQ